MFTNIFTYLDKVLNQYDVVIKVLYSCGVFIFGYVIKNLKDLLRKRKLKSILGLNRKIKNFVLYLPMRETHWGDKEQYMEYIVYLNEMLIATEMRNCISTISDKISFSLGKINEYNPLDNMFFYGGFSSHRYVEVLFKNFAKEGKIYFSTRESTYNKLNDEKKIIFRVTPNHATPYRYIIIQNNDATNYSNSGKWNESISKLGTKTYSIFAYQDNEEDIFFL